MQKPFTEKVHHQMMNQKSLHIRKRIKIVRTKKRSNRANKTSNPYVITLSSFHRVGGRSDSPSSSSLSTSSSTSSFFSSRGVDTLNIVGSKTTKKLEALESMNSSYLIRNHKKTKYGLEENEISNKMKLSKENGANTDRNQNDINVDRIHPSQNTKPIPVTETVHDTYQVKVLPIEKAVSIPTDIEHLVSRVVSMVAAEIRSGIWLCPFYDLDDDSIEILIESNNQCCNEENDNKHHDELKMKGISLYSNEMLHQLNVLAESMESFAKDILIPSFISARNAHQENHDHPSISIPTSNCNSANRILVASLLAIREILIINADDIFFLSRRSNPKRHQNTQTPTQSHMATSSSKSIEKNTITKRDDVSEYDTWTIQILSAGLLYHVIEKLESTLDSSNTQELSTLFSESLHKYDSADEEFSSCLERADARLLGIIPNGRILGREENLAWRASYNFARDRHPLIKRKFVEDVILQYERCGFASGNKVSETYKRRLLNRTEVADPDGSFITVIPSNNVN